MEMEAEMEAEMEVEVPPILYAFVIEYGEHETPRYFVHSSRNSCPEKAQIDCEILYDFMKQPMTVIETAEIQHVLDVDVYVKKWMWQNGIENVRGGSYNKETITDGELQILYNEYDNMEYRLLSSTDILDDLQRNYVREELGDPYYLQYEQWEVHKKYLEYTERKKQHHEVLFCQDNSIFRRCMLNDIRWIKEFLECDYEVGEKILTSTKAEYIRILSVLRNITTKFIDIGNESKIPGEKRVIYDHPEFVLDAFFYHRADIKNWDKDRQAAFEILDFFEYMCYAVINRLDELEFDVQSYPRDFDKKYEISMRFFDYWRSDAMIQIEPCD